MNITARRLIGSHCAAAALLACSILTASPAVATCGSATCFLVTGTEEGVRTPGAVRIDLSYSFIDQSRKLAGSHSVGEVLVPKVDFEAGVLVPDHHREIRTASTFVRLDLAYGATDRLTLLGTLPLYQDKYHEHYDDVGTPDEHFTSTDGTRGFGDVQLGARYLVLVRPKDLLVVGLTVKLPTGDYKLRDGEGAINEPTIQPGSGSYDLVVSLSYTHHPFPSELEWFVSGSHRLNAENDLDYRIGDETVLNAGVSHGGGGKIAWLFQVNSRHTSRDSFRGDNVPSTGTNYVDLTPGLRFTPSGGASLYAFIQLPIYERVNEAQLAPRSSFVVGVSKTF